MARDIVLLVIGLVVGLLGNWIFFWRGQKQQATETLHTVRLMLTGFEHLGERVDLGTGTNRPGYVYHSDVTADAAISRDG